MNRDKWSCLNEIVQNVLALGVVGAAVYVLTYRALVAGDADASTSLAVGAGAVLTFFGFNASQRAKCRKPPEEGGTKNPPPV